MNLPYDADAEEAVVGCCLFHAGPVKWVTEWLQPQDFFVPKWSAAISAITSLQNKGQACDPLTVSAEASLLGYELEAADLTSALSHAPGASEVERYGHIVRRNSVARSALRICTNAVSDLQGHEGDPDAVLDALQADLHSIDAHVPTGRLEGFQSFEDLRSRPVSARSPWVLHGLMRSDWRAMFVAREGIGKSLMLRQVAIAGASGASCFGRGGYNEPKRTLLVDLENPEDHLLDWVDRMCLQAEKWAKTTEGRGAVWHRPGGIDLRKRNWRSQFESILRQHKPDLVCLGPLYKSFRRKSSETEEEAAGEMQEILDDLRTRHRFGLIMEHHAPKGQQGQREMAPFGSSLWLRWGEIRMGLVAESKGFPVHTVRLEPFSGSRVDHDWPTHLDRNEASGFPWLGRWEKGMK